MIKSGTTGFIDAGSYYMEDAARVYAESGLRGALSYSTMDEEGLPQSIAMDAQEAVRRTDSLYDGFHGNGNLKVYLSLIHILSAAGLPGALWQAERHGKRPSPKNHNRGPDPPDAPGGNRRQCQDTEQDHPPAEGGRLL